MKYFYAGAVAVLAIIGIMHFGNFLNSRLPTVEPPLKNSPSYWVLADRTNELERPVEVLQMQNLRITGRYRIDYSTNLFK